ncbi:uncharacterized protein TrAtP1_000215 [Trichoderma atroviride]|uniref:uncharacterized protein n=1 Tax=Hypocrea atroviridis TaxID=63577 RepID=UPI0033249F18|nr:hypothetical protein TrAtP1_000215 [Trichoderma atroviride]
MTSVAVLAMSASVIAGSLQLPPGSSAVSPHSARARGGWDADPGNDAICGNKSDGMPSGSTRRAMAAAITVTASRLQHHSRKQVRAANDFCCFGTAQAHRWPALPHRGIRIFVQALLLQIIISPVPASPLVLLQGGRTIVPLKTATGLPSSCCLSASNAAACANASAFACSSCE